MGEDAAQFSDDELSQAMFNLLSGRFEVESQADPSVIVKSRPPALHVLRRGSLLTLRRGEGQVLLMGDLHTPHEAAATDRPIAISVVRDPGRRDLVVWQAYTPPVSAAALVEDIVKMFRAHTSA